MIRAGSYWRLLAVLACVFAPISSQEESPFREETKSCDPECTKHGNCNGETGQCDCPFGLTGPTCTERLFPACHSSKDSGTTPAYGDWFPKNCICIKQLRAFPGSCPEYLKYEGQGGPPGGPCFYDILMHHNLLCYKYKDRPEADQLTDHPAVNDTALEWFHVSAYPAYTEAPVPPESWPKEHKTPDGGMLQPLSACPDRCNHRGWCQIKGQNYQGGHWDSDEPWCSCHGYYEGKSCEIADPLHCYQGCSGVGKCVHGWCHCDAGYWGHGCTRSKAYTSSTGWRPNHGDIKIYVYDLPSNVVHRRDFNDNWALVDIMYNAEIEFVDKLLGDWSVRTENPWEATLFYVPTFTYWYCGNLGSPYFLIQHVTHHLRSLPFFNLTGGRNHVLMATNDRGMCKLQEAPLDMQHSIKIAHFGQAPRRPYARHSNQHAGHQLTEHLPLPGRRFEEFPQFQAQDILEENEICMRPEKDVVVPNYLPEGWVQPFNYDEVWESSRGPGDVRVPTKRVDKAERNYTLVFGGYNRPSEAFYSQGVRQALNVMFGPGGKHDPEGPNARHDFMVAGPFHGEAGRVMRSSKFCLAPMGSGWGIRLAESMVSGCVPVIVQDHVYQALWDVLPYEDFSVRISRANLHKIVEILDDIRPEQLKKLQEGVDKWHRAFYWDTKWGGLAYNHTITALKRRALRMWSQDYRHHHLHLR
ncbi:hypothetical protein HYH03_016055 [Edaphochlamys debaryana]|uniref:EGF-like domain-containing protein n=1 Tax=Edaphochlamys debaryana TaxID=47281 RepID=A0A835XQI8_9CHLO|nr:hypothetical protein HYH03_016055 [Edaphochlamys debaryana]|eukprot:KAG2485165.1 hypothetical protein HYH03_016055 [Edaphochlamys debaryana]